MSHDELLRALFPESESMTPDSAGIIEGVRRLPDGREVTVLGLTGAHPVGADLAIELSERVLRHVTRHAGRPLVLLIDAGSQLMARRDELLGLNEYLAHLTKSLYMASAAGSRTVGILYGAASAGAMIATAMAVDSLVAVPGAEPSVMNLAAMSRVTKLPLAQLEAMAGGTPVFAPGVKPLLELGGIAQEWSSPREYAARLQDLLASKDADTDERDALGAARGGRLKAGAIVAKVREEAARHV